MGTDDAIPDQCTECGEQLTDGACRNLACVSYWLDRLEDSWDQTRAERPDLWGDDGL